MEDLGDSQQLFLDKSEIPSTGKHFVSFWARDPAGKRKILLEGKETLYVTPGFQCHHFIYVTVMSRPKPSKLRLL